MEHNALNEQEQCQSNAMKKYFLLENNSRIFCAELSDFFYFWDQGIGESLI